MSSVAIAILLLSFGLISEMELIILMLFELQRLVIFYCNSVRVTLSFPCYPAWLCPRYLVGDEEGWAAYFLNSAPDRLSLKVVGLASSGEWFSLKVLSIIVFLPRSFE